MISRIKSKIVELRNRIANITEQNNGKMPRGKSFIATDTDFEVMKKLEEMTEEDFREHYGNKTEEYLSHLEQTIDTFNNPTDKEHKFDYTEKVIRQIYTFLKDGNVNDSEELLQTLYMTIFQRFNDDIKIEKNFHVTAEFVDKVYRFADEGTHPEVKEIVTSEKEVGHIYMREEQYDKIVDIWNRKYESEKDRRLSIKFEMVNYILRNIRNRMMHGDFHNKSDLQGNKIVEIFPNDFKGKFFFDCIQEFYEAIVKEINDNKNSFGKTKTEKINDRVLFSFKDALLKRNLGERTSAIAAMLNDEEAKKEGFKSEDIKMMLILPLYVNSFITYNFKQKNSLEQLAKRFRKSGESKKVSFLDSFYKSKSEDSFTAKVVEYNRVYKNTNFLPNEVFEHFRNAIVHNNFVCKDRMIYLRDENPNTGEINDVAIPYEFIEELIEKQYNCVKEKNATTLPDDPDDEGR